MFPKHAGRLARKATLAPAPEAVNVGDPMSLAGSGPPSPFTFDLPCA
jgi:hypothetical protein